MPTATGEPLIRTWSGLALSVATLAWLWTSARRRVARSHGPIAPDDAWSATMVWSALALTGTALLLGIIGRLAFVPWCAAVGLAGVLLRRLGVRADAQPPVAPPPADPTAPSILFQVLLGGYLLGRALFSLRNPPWDLDSLDYHLPMIAHWMASGTLGVALHEPIATATYYPGNFELLQTWAVWSAGRDTFVYWPVILSIGLTAVAARRLAITFGAPRALAEALTLALATAPGIAGMTKGLQGDTYIAGCLAVALRFGLRYRERALPADAAVLLAALALTAGSRFTGPALAGVVLALVWLAPGCGTRRWPRAPAALWAIALLVGGFWLVRNAVASGNPLFPTEAVLGSLRLPGPLAHAIMSRTTQLAVWREGYAGQLTIAHLYRFYDLPLFLIAAGTTLWALGRAFRPRRAAGGAGAEWPILAVFALATFALYLVSYYSGVNWPPRDGRPAVLTVANVRYLLPGLIAIVPLAGLGLSSTPALTATGVAFGLGLSLWQLRALLGHVGPGLFFAAGVVAALYVPILRALRSRVMPLALPLVLGLPLAWVAVSTDGVRGRASAQAWDDYRSRIHVLPAALGNRVRAHAAGRPVACVGLHTVYQITGRDFTGRPVYAPVALSWREADSPWRFATDAREHGSRERWLENLAAAHAALVVVATEDSLHPPIERAWCEADPARFRPIARSGGDDVYEIRPAGRP